MAVAKIYNSQTGQWEAVIVGTTGDTGVVQSATEPSNTDQLWLDTDDTAEPLAIPAGGSAGQILQKSTDGDYDTAWSNVPSHNYIINGAFDIAQRGTSFPDISFEYSLDRWEQGRGAFQNNLTVSQVAATGLDNIEYAMRLQRDSGDTNTGNFRNAYILETADSIPLAGRPVTLSFYARAGSDFSQSVNVVLRSGTGEDEGDLAASDNFATGPATVIDETFTFTTSWARYEMTGTVSATATQLGILIRNPVSGTAGANEYYDITGVQLEAGSVATPFKRNAPSLQGELAACQRYYYRVTSQDSLYAPFPSFGLANTTTTAYVGIMAPVQMRSIPDTLDYANVSLYNGASFFTVTGLALDAVSRDHTTLTATTSGLTAKDAVRFQANNTTASFIGLSAEL